MAARLLSAFPISVASPASHGRKTVPSSSSSSLSMLRTLTPEFLVVDSHLHSPSSTPILRRRNSPVMTLLFMLPTAKPDRGPADKVPKWSARAIKSFGMAELEARKLKYPTAGTEALLMGILVEGTSSAAKFLRANGITLLKVREEIVKLLGKSDMYYFSPEHPPLTEPAQRALDWAVDEKMKSGMFRSPRLWH